MSHGQPLEGQPQRRVPIRPNYNQIHSKPLPLNVYPLPFYAPQNPLSLVHITYVLVKDYLLPRKSHPEKLYQGYFDKATRSVHVTDPATVRALWEQGFFGKGLLSRSEPNWLDQQKKRLGLAEGLTAEQVTEQRRRTRENFKRERARLEREAIEAQKRKEAGSPLKVVKKEEMAEDTLMLEMETAITANGTQEIGTTKSGRIVAVERQQLTPEQEAEAAALVNQEHLHISREEAFFLSYALGSLEIIDGKTNKLIKDQSALLQLFRQNSYFPPARVEDLKPDDQFLLSYVIYHHFRSLGWVVRDGIKFAVDYMLYQRGPAFTHAAFALIIIPSYTHAYWYETPNRKAKVEKHRAQYNWHWFHQVNRVQTAVVKTLVLVYVDVPPPMEGGVAEEGKDIGLLLRRYKIREFAVQRWSSNRSRG
ncbi:hypothetical protein EJ08DRAFT_577758 [Tothia fuscella]|uniref:tRNA-splicing endonuclease subunit Sen2 n=1 Tax=Tothia fuscella TaxID=1048955 RepID=A0A9P4P4E6_9PEZI|nr:hypothetical protein EJ08DRAFT_577758 [Tothia fuscella]